MTLFADILLPVAVPRAFTYAVPVVWEEALQVGMLVRVPLGKNKVCEGIVQRLHQETPATKTPPKTILERIGDSAVVTPAQLELWEWMARYYMCTVGEVMKAALPTGIRGGTYSPATELFVRLTASCRTCAEVAELLEQLRRAKVQAKVLLAYLALIPADEQGEPQVELSNRELLWVERSLITESLPASAILKLVERGILEQCERVPESSKARRHHPHPLSSAENLISSTAVESQTTLLRGHPSDFLPHYIQSVQSVVDAGKQVLVLLPGTLSHSALIEAFQDAFGSRCVLFHARQTDHLRSALHHRMITDPEGLDVVVGTRSALFLPFARLGLVIIDQEHDLNYRQSDPAPRYHGRDTALMLAHRHGARTLLASATPSLESWNNQIEGKYGLLAPTHPAGLHTPKTTVLERGKGLISKYLHKRIEETLTAGRQVILFQNRRGFAPYLVCENCGATPTCPDCNVTLTYHKESQALQCHYCGWTQSYVSTCSACGLQTLTPRGIGTERVEEAVTALFPAVPIARLDADVSPRVKGRTIADFAQGQTGILIGTQLVVRTASLGDVGLVGVINADNLLSYPDFRAAERAFQLLRQLQGLIGADGEMVVQSAQRLHPVLIALANDDTAGFYAHELEERRGSNYPPYVRMIRLLLRHPSPAAVQAAADHFHALLDGRFKGLLSLPFEPPVDRVQNLHLLHLLLRIPPPTSLTRTKALLAEALAVVRKAHPAVYIRIEVDPQ